VTNHIEETRSAEAIDSIPSSSRSIPQQDDAIRSAFDRAQGADGAAHGRRKGVTRHRFRRGDAIPPNRDCRLTDVDVQVVSHKCRNCCRNGLQARMPTRLCRLSNEGSRAL